MLHRARKRFGQNFLQVGYVINDIVAAINPQPNDIMLEIGPGLGALTIPLLRQLNQLIAIEIDVDLQDYLQTTPLIDANKLQLVASDALSVDYQTFGHNLRIVGNLPYNISTPLLFHLLHYVEHIADMHFMLQKEVVLRLAAQPGSKAYGRLSVMLQYYCEVYYLFTVPPTAFSPEPKVESAIVRLIPHKVSPYPVVPFANLERLVASAFSMRRKTLANNLKPWITAEQLMTINIDPSLRPEQISVAQYATIVSTLGLSLNEKKS